jgi:hypothetical protein
MTEAEEFAWAVGLFEGEGSIIYGPRDGGIRRRLFLGTSDGDVIKHFHQVIGVGKVTGPYKRISKTTGQETRSMWYWALNNWVEIEPLLKQMLPFLGDRRKEKALQLLADPARPYRSVGLR